MNSKLKAHSPLLLNPWGILESLPWWTPKETPAQACDHVRLHDYVKVGLHHPACPEFIWLEVCMRSKSYWVGQVRSQTTLVEQVKLGDLIRFHPTNVYEIRKNSEDAF